MRVHLIDALDFQRGPFAAMGLIAVWGDYAHKILVRGPCSLAALRGVRTSGALLFTEDQCRTDSHQTISQCDPPDWLGDSYIGTGWAFNPKKIISNLTGRYALGDLRGSRGGVTSRDVYILLSEWDCSDMK